MASPTALLRMATTPDPAEALTEEEVLPNPTTDAAVMQETTTTNTVSDPEADREDVVAIQTTLKKTDIPYATQVAVVAEAATPLRTAADVPTTNKNDRSHVTTKTQRTSSRTVNMNSWT